jgi:hypothetical protein
MMKLKRLTLAALVVAILLTVTGLCSCKQKVKTVYTDTLTTGTIEISVDESFKPVIDEQIKVFEASFPEAKVNVVYKPEADCLKDVILNPNTRMAIVTRGLSAKEENYFDAYKTKIDCYAYDVTFANSNSNPQLVTGDKKKFYHNYFIGNDSKQWAGNVPVFESIIYKEMYMGIDVKAYSASTSFKYDIVVHPNANAAQIKIRFAGFRQEKVVACSKDPPHGRAPGVPLPGRAAW